MINRFVLNEVSYFGPGAREVLPQEIKRLGLKKAFVSTDKDLIKFGVADKVLSVLDKAGIPYVVFSDIKPNPTVSNVNAGVKAFAESGADFILAIGGGSSIDTSKAIGIITNNPEFSDVVSLEGVAPTQKKSVPIIMEFNAPAALDKYVEIAKAMKVYKEGMGQEEAARAAVDAVRALSVRVGIPQHLSELGIKESDLDKLATAAIADVCTPGNPREVTKEIILDLYKKAL